MKIAKIGWKKGISRSNEGKEIGRYKVPTYAQFCQVRVLLLPEKISSYFPLFSIFCLLPLDILSLARHVRECAGVTQAN